MKIPRNHRYAAMILEWLDDNSCEAQRLNIQTNMWESVENPTWSENNEYRLKTKINCVTESIINKIHNK